MLLLLFPLKFDSNKSAGKTKREEPVRFSRIRDTLKR